MNIILTLLLLATSAGARVVPHKTEGSSVIIKNNRLAPKTPGFSYDDPERQVLVACRDGWILLVVNGSLQLLNAKTLDLAPFRGGKGFALDRLFDSVRDQGERIEIVRHYEGGEGETKRPETFHIDLKKRSIKLVPTDGWPESRPSGPLECSPLPGVEVFITNEDFRITKSE